MQGNRPDEEYEDPHAACAHEIARLRDALAALRDGLSVGVNREGTRYVGIPNTTLFWQAYDHATQILQ